MFLLYECLGKVLEAEQQCEEQAVGVLLQAQQALRRYEQMGPGQQLRIFTDIFCGISRDFFNEFNVEENK